MDLPPIVSTAEWQEARERLLVKEKEATRARDALAAERRRLPMARIDKDYVFEGPSGKARLGDLFDGRRQLILYHFMFAPSAEGWPEAGCPERTARPSASACSFSTATTSIAPTSLLGAGSRRWVASGPSST